MKQNINSVLPEIWLMVLIIALPQLSETVYSPSLPDIARSLMTSHALVEYTLTIFLFGLALGTLFWGKLSDKYGRKPALLSGLILYSIGCIGCYFSTTIFGLMISRFVQAFGGSTGSVLGQVICRDAFHGAERGKVFSIIGSSLALAPALGPVIGGTIAQSVGWSAIFLFLTFVSFATLFLVYYRLPETYTPTNFSLSLIKNTAISMLFDSKVLGFGLLVGLCNGISFSYFAEGSFCLINVLGLSPSMYGATFVILSMATMLGGYLSKKMNEQNVAVWDITSRGALLILYGAMQYVFGMMFLSFMNMGLGLFIVLILTSMACIMAGIGLMIPNVLAIALKDYQAVLGTASSLFGFYYYCLISLLTLIMGLLHNHTLWPMPIYFLCMAIMVHLVVKYLRRMDTLSA